MPLKAKIANKTVVNESGMVEGTIINIIDIEEHEEIEKGKSVTYGAQFEFQIKAKGTQKDIVYRIWTSQKIDDRKYEFGKKQDFNKFTRLLIQLEVLNDECLENGEYKNIASKLDLETLIDTKVQFELENSEKNKMLKIPKVSSICLVKPS